METFPRKLLLTLVIILIALPTRAQDFEVNKELGDFDKYMQKVLADWNTPGAGVGIVVRNKLVFAKGYGYRDYGKRLPVTTNTLFQIASNTKLFTAVAVGLLVQEGKIDWDKPISRYVPTIQFYDDDLNNTVTVRDMLAHRTGISRQDLIWYKSDFTRRQLFDRLKYLEPSQPVRHGFLYNNMMYTACGYAVEYLSGKTWEDFLREKIFMPLDMKSTVFSIADMTKQPDYFVPYNEKRDTTILYKIPYTENTQGLGPAGSIISNINDLSRWLIALMNDGVYKSKQVIPSGVIRATLTPSIAVRNTQLEDKGYSELLNPVYGMGRDIASYRGHYFTYHGGALGGIFSQISSMPYDSIGVIVFVIGRHSYPLQDVITYNIYERLLGLDQTPWSERKLKERQSQRDIARAGRTKAGHERVAGTKPSHSREDPMHH